MSGIPSLQASLVILSSLALVACAAEEPVPDPSAETPAVESAGQPMADSEQMGGLLDPDVADESALAEVPHMTPEIAAQLIEARPFEDMLALDALLAETLDETQREEVYGHLFKRLDLNGASEEEILLIPGVGSRIAHEFEEYRPYIAIEQFRREMGKYMDDEEVARLEQYVRVP